MGARPGPWGIALGVHLLPSHSQLELDVDMCLHELSQKGIALIRSSHGSLCRGTLRYHIGIQTAVLIKLTVVSPSVRGNRSYCRTKFSTSVQAENAHPKGAAPSRPRSSSSMSPKKAARMITKLGRNTCDQQSNSRSNVCRQTRNYVAIKMLCPEIEHWHTIYNKASLIDIHES